MQNEGGDTVTINSRDTKDSAHNKQLLGSKYKFQANHAITVV